VLGSPEQPLSLSVPLCGRRWYLCAAYSTRDSNRRLRTHQVDPALLEFEITEGTFMAHGEVTDATLRKLKQLGISIAIDDFGTGYSNLAYLKRFQVDALKIDIAFIRDIATDADAATIAVAITGTGVAAFSPG